MQKRRLGQSTLEVSVIGLGGNNFGGRIDFDAAERVVHRAIELGINLIDTADSYGNRGGSEEALGRILGQKRKQIVLATKFGMPMDDSGKLGGASRAYVMQAAEASLKRLKTEWIDLYQLHQPDPRTLIEETLRALDDLVRQGKVRFIGWPGGTWTPPSERALQFMVDNLPARCIWNVSVMNPQKQWPILALAVALGGHVRVGYEDNPYIAPGEFAKNNAVLVERMVAIARGLGREIATPDEARAILGLSRSQ